MNLIDKDTQHSKTYLTYMFKNLEISLNQRFALANQFHPRFNLLETLHHHQLRIRAIQS